MKRVVLALSLASPRVISPLTPADDFARQLSHAEFLAAAETLATQRAITVCSAVPDGLEPLRRELGDARADSLVREMTLFIRRNLRGSDAVSVAAGELLLLLDAPGTIVTTVADRLLAAVRGHVFSGGASDRSLRLTLTIGLASAPEQGCTMTALLESARAARAAGAGDETIVAGVRRQQLLDVRRFVGRGEQLASFANYLDDMVRGVGRVITVVGESGVGASSLVRALEPEVRVRGGSLVSGNCHPRPLAAPYTLWRSVLRAVRRLPVKSTRVWRELPALDRSLEGSVERVQLGGSKTQLLEELADFLRLAAQQRPLVILLEDLQWADNASIDALEYLVSQLESERIMLLLTFQTGTGNDDVFERWSQLAGRPRHHEMRLSRLTREDVKHWLEGAMRTDEPRRDLLAHLYRHTEGNPLLLIHLVRDLEESGHIVQRQGSWRWTSVASLPGALSIDSLLARRIGRILPEDRPLFDAAVVLGREADEALLIDLSGMERETSSAAIRRLLALGLLVSSFDRERTTYVPAHDEIARVGRELLDPGERRRIHGVVARVLARAGGAAAAEIAGHYEDAGELTQAHRFALDGADEALAVHENAAVVELLAAAERTAPDEAALAEVRVRMASLADAAGRYEEAEQYCDVALAWYESQQDAVAVLRLKRTRARVRMLRGQSASDTLQALLALEQEAMAVGAEAERAAILLLIAHIRWRLGDGRAAQRVAAECVTIAERVGSDQLLADACNRYAATIQMEEPARARALFGRSLEISTSLGDAFRRTRALSNIGVLELLTNNWLEARRMLTMAAEQSRTAGLIEAWGRAELNLGVLAARLGDFDGASRALSEALRLAAMVQDTDGQLISTYNIAHLERELERYREAIDTYGLVHELSARIGQAEIQTGALAGQGVCRLQTGDVAGARKSLEAAATLSAPLEDWFQGRELVGALRIHLLLVDGEKEQAVQLFQDLLQMADPTDVFAAAWLTAEFLHLLHPMAPGVIEGAVRRYQGRSEVLDNPKISARFAVLKIDT